MGEDQNVDGREELSALASSRSAFVTYRPLEEEVPFETYLTLPSGAIRYEIAPQASLDPKEEAARAMATIGRYSAAILLPGRRFDAFGTRHGKGGGWYDRFLAAVPRKWIRIGFCRAEQFSLAPLLRQEWDQPVDFVAIADGTLLRLHTASATMPA